MKNHINEGELVTITAGANLTSGQGLLVGKLFGVVQETVLSGAQVALKRRGLFTMPKATSEAWTVGALLYWNDTTKVLTTTASGNLLVGVAESAAQAAETSGRAILDGTFR